MDIKSNFLDRYIQKGRELLQQGALLGIEFAGATYQAEVIDPESKEIYWPFIKLAEDGSMQDAFCSCEESDKEGICEHLAAAWLRIYQEHNQPLHLRFQSSLWNKIAELFAEHVGYDPYLLQKEDGTYLALEDAKRRLEIRVFSAQEKEKLQQILYQRKKESEENSLKFADLSQEEIQKWKEGRPSSELRYLLSFWFDLAAWWMELQDLFQSPKISFKEKDHLPTEVTFFWEGKLEVNISLQQEDLLEIIPSLTLIDSPLKIRQPFRKKIKAIRYDRKGCRLLIEKEAGKLLPKHEGINLNGWIYVSGFGFIDKEEKSPFEKDIIQREEIAKILDSQKDVLEKYLKEEIIHKKAVPLRYKMYFDKEWNWHFEGYLFEEGDLQKQESAFFGSWVYLSGAGFFPINFFLFGKSEEIIPAYLVSAFVDEHRAYLNRQPGFATHLAGVESQLTYVVNEDASLEFKSLKLGEEYAWEAHDFGQWIYTPKEGFFSKSHSRIAISIRPGLKIAAADVSDFIKSRRDELESIPYFFFLSSPILSRGLSFSRIDENAISIRPDYEINPIYKELRLTFYNDIVYLENRGFFELPSSLRLPKQYSRPLKIQGDALEYFLRFEFQDLLPLAFSVDATLKKPHLLELEIEELTRDSGGGFNAKIYLKTEIGKTDVFQIARDIQEKKRFSFTKAGLLDLNHELFSWLKSDKIKLDFEQKSLLIPTIEFLRIDATFGFLSPEEKMENREGIVRILEELRSFSASKIPELKGLKSTLRPYQQTGLSWLFFLYQNALSGILCDEMGLGKTHQAMALIAAISNLSNLKGGLRFLVVCPTSVIYHWQDKLQRFFPKLQVHLFHGAKRSLKRLPKNVLLLTSYGICRTENENLKKIPFELAIFDELQIAKNPQSRIHKALGAINAKMRLGLTGTPIENTLWELKSLFDLIIPGFMPRASVFRDLFINPIEKGNDEERAALLRELIKPFILRRKKQDVLAELPSKTEENAICFLSKEQSALYNQILNRESLGLISDLKKQKAPVPYVHIFAVLSKLKQVCNHPALIEKDPMNYTKYRSGKWELFVELLNEARESGQKVVVFSQYLMMLDIIELYIKERGWEFAGIRGDTLDRKEQILRFQEDPNCHLFIGSLNAAGLGIDLTAASTVILFDRWWNAARENQAIDRVHRIGQKWAVQVFRFITKGTIEEKIDSIVQRKKKLMEDIVTADEQEDIKRFTREELIELLSFIPYEEEEWTED